MSERKRYTQNPIRWFVSSAGLILFLAMLFHPDATSQAVTDGMFFFVQKLAPVLFPYMVLSHFFCTYGLLDPLVSLLPTVMLFGMNPCAFSVFLMGQLCGYPVGAKMAAAYVKSGKLSRCQGSLLCGISSGASPAFLLYTVGAGYRNDLRFGIFLLCLQIFLGLVAGMLLSRGLPAPDPSEKYPADPVPFPRCFCDAVGGSALQLVPICGFIVFFTLVLSILPAEEPFRTWAASVLEFSSGVRFASGFPDRSGLFLTGFSVGWGGLSVLAQVSAMLSDSSISLRFYLIYKLISGIFFGIASVLYGVFFPTISCNIWVDMYPVTPVNPFHIVWFAGILGMMWYFSRRPAGCKH